MRNGQELLCLSKYNFTISERSEKSITLNFTLVIGSGMNEGLVVKKYFTLIKDSYVLKVVVEIENPTEREFLISDYFEEGLIGYALAWSSIIGESSVNDLQAWKSGGTTHWELKEHFVRTYSADIEWCAVYDYEEGGIVIMISKNTTVAIWRESDPTWGMKSG